MWNRRLLLALAVAGIATCDDTAEVAASPPGGLTILSYNDLTNDPAPGSAALLVHEATNYTALSETCASLSETPLDPETAVFDGALNNSLSYQVYIENFPRDQLFWVLQSPDDASCTAVDYKGDASPIDCGEKLPGLCTQSAPVSTSETNDDPTDYHVTHRIDGQLYEGYRDHFSFKFRGLRYARYDKTRWVHSVLWAPPSEGHNESISALKAGADCMQPIGEVQEGMSEDCLFLNVWTPSLPGPSNPKLKPVMFYIYGGGFTSGSGKNPNTDGTMIASRGDIVAVSMNYRVGNLGFLNFNDVVHNGNYGLGDIFTALTWVKRNIASLGGDPDRITIYGESAGAVAVRAILASHRSEGRIQYAISQSGPAGLTGNEGGMIARYDTTEWDYEHTTKHVIEQAGCDGAGNVNDVIRCMYEVNATDLVNFDTKARGIIRDGNIIDVDHLPLDGWGFAHQVVVMTGTNRDELAVDHDMPAEGTTFEDIVDGLSSQLGIDVTPLRDSPAFPLPEDATPEELLKWGVRVTTDAVYTCAEHATSLEAAQNYAFDGVYTFLFNRTYNPSGYTKPHCGPPATEEFPDGDPNLEYMKCHAGEQMYVFGTLLRAGLPDRDGKDVPFMQLVVDYWTSFARTGDPNPQREYLEARGYWGTLSQVEEVGRWEKGNGEEAEVNLRLLQWDGGHVEVPEREQCEALGLGLDFWDALHMGEE